MTTIAINLPLVDERACTGCPYLDAVFVTRLCKLFNRLTPRRDERLPECIAAQVEEPDRG